MRSVTRHASGRALRGLIAAAFLSALAAPAPSLAADTTATPDPVPAPRVAPKDPFEADDTPRQATVPLRPDVWAGMAAFGGAPVIHSRTFHSADDAAPDSADQDWIRLQVDEAAALTGMSLLVEAVSADPRVDPVVEVYGPFAAGEYPSATPAAALPSEAGVTVADPVALAGFDDEPWFAAGSASASLVLDPYGDAAGTYYVRIRPYWSAEGGFAGGAGPYTLRIKAGLATRLAGADRFDTAVRVSRERYPAGALTGGACVIAGGEGFADALSGSTLAGAVGGPLLLTRRGSLPSSVASEVRRLGVATVYVLGSTKVVGGAVARALDGIAGVSVVRLAGRDRYETAIRVAERVRALAGAAGEEPASVAFVASGADFPDALSAAPMAAYNAAPVLLTPPDRAHPAVLSALARLGVTDAVVVGGEAALSREVSREFERRLGRSHVRRVAGSDRYQTSRALAAWAVAGGADGRVGTAGSPSALAALQPSSVGLASGTSFPDALTGGVFCGQRGAPVLLTQRDALSSGVLGYADSVGRPLFLKSYVFGGKTVISQGTADHFDLLTTAWWGPQR